ncbi:hypothetical protein E2C01_052032 [Portunus trituberculatus]|uniref:Uncharacterized protein n=1 Tax=Portunus trituberculatus TaxID=210409 RepID=A0A5B7GCJ5_PORTR|nr:hypothetical protein [Portunus trituberculatus]
MCGVMTGLPRDLATPTTPHHAPPHHAASVLLPILHCCVTHSSSPGEPRAGMTLPLLRSPRDPVEVLVNW